MATQDYCWENVICGHNIYKTIWMPEIGETLHCEQERSNHKDPYAASMMKMIPYSLYNLSMMSGCSAVL